MTSKVNRFAFADGLRGLAALWVVLYHLAEGHHIEHLKTVMPTVSYNVLFGYGNLGVAVFFVLSGFVMAYNVSSYNADVDFSIKFILRRLIRLSPPYYFAIFFAILFLLIKKQTTGAELSLPNAENIIAHIFYLQGFLEMPEINFVFWTLIIEIQFYIAFSFMVFLADGSAKFFHFQYSRHLISILVSLLALPWGLSLIKSPIWPGGFLPYWYCFISGVLVCWGMMKGGAYRYFVTTYILLIGIAGIISHNMYAVITSATAVLLLVAGIYGYMNYWLSWKWLQSLGLISYSLYLLHNPITGATVNVVKRFVQPGVIADVMSLGFALLSSLVVAWLAYRMIEMPSIKWSHKIVLKKN